MKGEQSGRGRRRGMITRDTGISLCYTIIRSKWCTGSSLRKPKLLTLTPETRMPLWKPEKSKVS